MTALTNAKRLRKQSTPMENKIWHMLRSRHFEDLKFRRQCLIGNYIVDFICIEKKLIIEIDGGHDSDPEQQAYDEKRTAFLNQLGYKVVRFWNNVVSLQFDAVMEQLFDEVKSDI
jgi:very-short-patch-repair endonuclease